MISLEPYLRIIPAILFLHASVLVGCATQLKPKDRTPPIAPIEPHIVQLHGKRHLDNYFWLKSPRDHRREIYIESENRYAQESLKDLKPLQESIYREMFERININDSSVPFQWGPYIYSSRLVQGLPFPIHMRTPVSDPTKEEVVLDLNTIVRRYPQAKLGAFRMSPDHRFVAFTLKEQAGRPYSLYIQSIEKPAVTYIATQISEIEWGHDAKSIYYLKQNDLGRSDELFLVENLPQVIKASKSISARENLVYRETDPAYHLRLSRSKNGRFVFFSAESVNTRQAFYIDLKTSAHTAKPLRPRIEGTKDTLGHRGNKFLIKSEENGRNAILFSTDVNSP
ncbi:MAG: hypothetical protein KDD53_11495, partial [Bdellovibrionales bacterium]|nr:hypothetical protein [Bdellovibrionales bacterium]